jgi:molybdenum-dependent DNA-binding transcriptional regulator ModE
MMVQTQPSKHKRKVTLMLQNSEKIIGHKVGLLSLAEELGNVSKACQIMGFSRDTFYR